MTCFFFFNASSLGNIFICLGYLSGLLWHNEGTAKIDQKNEIETDVLPYLNRTFCSDNLLGSFRGKKNHSRTSGNGKVLHFAEQGVQFVWLLTGRCSFWRDKIRLQKSVLNLSLSLCHSCYNLWRDRKSKCLCFLGGERLSNSCHTTSCIPSFRAREWLSHKGHAIPSYRTLILKMVCLCVPSDRPAVNPKSWTLIDLVNLRLVTCCSFARKYIYQSLP